MALTQEQLQRRRQFVTASEVPAVMGLNPPGWMNAGDVYMSKLYQSADFSSDAMEAGNILQPAILTWATTKIGPLVGHEEWIVSECGVIAGNLDDRTVEGGYPVEAKSSCIVGFNSAMADKWGEEYTDEIPDNYLAQVQTQLLLSKKPFAFVPALIGGRGFVMYQVEANVSFQKQIQSACHDFWHNHVQPQIPPSKEIPDYDTVKRIKRTPNKTVDIPYSLVAAFQDLNQQRLDLEKMEKRSKAALVAALGDAEAGRYASPNGGAGVIEFFEQSRAGFTTKATTFRKLNIK